MIAVLGSPPLHPVGPGVMYVKEGGEVFSFALAAGDVIDVSTITIDDKPLSEAAEFWFESKQERSH